MAAEILSNQNGTVHNGDLSNNHSGTNPSAAAASKKSRESERRRRRRKQKKNKNKNTSQQQNDAVSEAGDSDVVEDETNEKSNNQQEQVVIEYVPEKAELDDGIDDEFRKIFEKFTFWESAASEETDKKDESAQDADVKKKADSDSDEEEQDSQQKEKGGISNKKKKLQRRMKIAELKQICSRPDVVEVWDATAADPKLLVFLKAYRNTVPVPRHWSQKRKYLQGSGCDSFGASTYRCCKRDLIDFLLK